MNVVTEQIKRTKTKGSLKGNILFFVLYLYDFCIYEFTLYYLDTTNQYSTNSYKRFVRHRNRRHGFQVKEENHYCQETNCKEM
jgi:hypothetical protein